jgi:hypothetical protein
MTIKEGRDMAAILGVLRDSFRNSAMHNGVIDSFILMDKPIAQPGALGNAQSKGNGEHPCPRCSYKGVIIILGRRACQLDNEMGIDVNSGVYKELEQTFGRVAGKRLLKVIRIRQTLERGQGSEILHNLAQLAIDEFLVNHGGLSPQKALNTNAIQSAQMRHIGMPFGG